MARSLAVLTTSEAVTPVWHLFDRRHEARPGCTTSRGRTACLLAAFALSNREYTSLSANLMAAVAADSVSPPSAAPHSARPALPWRVARRPLGPVCRRQSHYLKPHCRLPVPAPRTIEERRGRCHEDIRFMNSRARSSGSSRPRGAVAAQQAQQQSSSSAAAARTSRSSEAAAHRPETRWALFKSVAILPPAVVHRPESRFRKHSKEVVPFVVGRGGPAALPIGCRAACRR